MGRCGGRTIAGGNCWKMLGRTASLVNAAGGRIGASWTPLCGKVCAEDMEYGCGRDWDRGQCQRAAKRKRGRASFEKRMPLLDGPAHQVFPRRGEHRDLYTLRTVLRHPLAVKTVHTPRRASMSSPHRDGRDGTRDLPGWGLSTPKHLLVKVTVEQGTARYSFDSLSGGGRLLAG